MQNFLTLKRELDGALAKTLTAAAKRLGLTVREAEVVSCLFCGGCNAEVLAERGLTAEVKALCDNQLAQLGADGTVTLTGHGEIAGKAVAQAQQRLLNNAFASVSPEERFIFNAVAEKVIRGLSENS